MSDTDNTTQKYQFNAFMLLFLLSNVQIGVGIFGFQRYIYNESKHDAWLSVILIGIVTHLIMWIMIATLKKHESFDLFDIHRSLFGKWIGSVISICLMIYFIINMTAIIRTYIEAVQSWIFPDFPTWLLSLILLVLMVYGSLGGIRVILQLSFICFFLILGTLILFYYPLQYAEWRRILPIYNTTMQHLLSGAKKMGFTIAGFEIIYFVYHHVKDKNKVMRYAQGSILFTNLLYLIIMIISIVYFSENQMPKTIWGSINLLKIIKYPFLERIEFIAIPFWMFVVVPGLMMLAWVLLRGTSKLFGWNQKLTLYGLAGVVFIASIFFQNRRQIDQLNDFIGEFSIIVSYLYPCLLFVLTYAAAWWRNRKGSKA
ncbi:spore gernimation protein [Paenibacillus selenitireducens]|uniref:Spore gernimation protein n=1 Tax=Paenibacillus selenitireducens TaxID=1324314 RepID=A0A1T2X5B1_9BACL|nr:GerAB/ArcD/ProY family transporter [Paenibacillus selenitireducens]OPA75091.1 spore gernimation protein [Paenibacillus selenitireducens]